MAGFDHLTKHEHLAWAGLWFCLSVFNIAGAATAYDRSLFTAFVLFVFGLLAFCIMLSHLLEVIR